jgi:Flp pilus assembly pilin Flp
VTLQWRRGVRRGERGSIAVEFAIVASAVAIALLAPWGSDGSVAERLLRALLDFWQGLARIIARI